MTNRNTILNELKDLGSALSRFTIPKISIQYLMVILKGWLNQILNRIKALEASDAKEELIYLSPFLSNVSKEMPYSVPAGYFQNLSEDIIAKDQ